MLLQLKFHLSCSSDLKSLWCHSSPSGSSGSWTVCCLSVQQSVELPNCLNVVLPSEMRKSVPWQTEVGLGNEMWSSTMDRAHPLSAGALAVVRDLALVESTWYGRKILATCMTRILHNIWYFRFLTTGRITSLYQPYSCNFPTVCPYHIHLLEGKLLQHRRILCLGIIWLIEPNSKFL